MAIDRDRGDRPDVGLLFFDMLQANGSTPWRELSRGLTTVSIAVPGGGAVCKLEVSYDGGATAYGVAPTSLTICNDTTGNMSFPVYEEELYVLYRMTVSNYASGTASIRYSGSAPPA